MSAGMYRSYMRARRAQNTYSNHHLTAMRSTAIRSVIVEISYFGEVESLGVSGITCCDCLRNRTPNLSMRTPYGYRAVRLCLQYCQIEGRNIRVPFCSLWYCATHPERLRGLYTC